jgi:hypothetical protein
MANMKCFGLLILGAFLFWQWLIPLRSWADEAAEARALAREMCDRVQRARDEMVRLEYLHWPTLYAAQQSARRRFSSAEAFRDYSLRAAREPERLLMESARGMMPNQRLAMEPWLEKAAQSLRAQRERRGAELSRTRFEIGAAAIDGERAKVKIVRVVDDRRSEEELELRLVEGRWYLASSPAAPPALGRAKRTEPVSDGVRARVER